MSTTDGGPAFPGEESVRFSQDNGCNEGMSLRDYFAAKAMQAIISKVDLFFADNGEHPIVLNIALGAYDYADAMLKARGESKESGDEA